MSSDSDILPLQQLIFNFIKKNFSYYASCHRYTENERLKKNFLFLQRVCTQKLFCELKKGEKLQKEHFDFLLNENLKQLDIAPLLEHFCVEEILDKVIPIAHNLKEISCSAMKREPLIKNACILLSKLFPYLTNVEKVVLPTICNDELLEIISSSCPCLTELDVNNSEGITGKGLEVLFLKSDGVIKAKCPIKTLNLIKGTELNIEEVAFLLQYLPTLEEVQYYRLPAVLEYLYQFNSERALSQETTKYNLLSLDFMNCDVCESTNILSVCVKTCPKLKTLSIDIDYIEDLNIIGRFQELENLCLTGYLNDNVINDFLVLKGRKLKNLSLEAFELSLMILIENCPNLESLSLQCMEYQEATSNSRNFVLNQLQSLELEETVMFDWSFTSIIFHSSPNLETLILRDCEFGKTSFYQFLEFSQNCKLKHLVFKDCSIDIDYLLHFVRAKRSVRKLSLDSCESIRFSDIVQLDQNIKKSGRIIQIEFDEDYDEYEYEDIWQYRSGFLFW